jgi:hypothetical protein
MLPGFNGTPFKLPTRLPLPAGSVFHGEEKQHLALDMHGNAPPTLLETLDGFYRGTKQLCQLALRFSQLASNRRELLFVHRSVPPGSVFIPRCGSCKGERYELTKILDGELDIRSAEVKFLTKSTTMWYIDGIMNLTITANGGRR